MTHVTISPPDVTEVEEQTAEETIAGKILHILKIYPVISHSMLQIGLGSSLPPALWRPVLTKLMRDNLITEDHLFLESPSGRSQTYTQLRLKGTTYNLQA